ncbi:NAD(P)-binding protein [Luminiphilus sp.]|nr:NAD(P)-binding protein [Luminiphilus sp.]
MTGEPTKVAIIGGGCSAMATAFDLTRPELEGQYQVTIYQQGFRLGGKGASGRGPGDRIEEHGLHIFMGFYENAFRLIRECYRELDRPSSSRFADWDDVFKPDRLTGVKDDHHDGTASHWLTWFPPGAGTPGDPDAPPRMFSASEYMARGFQLLEATLLSARRDEVLDARDDNPEAMSPSSTPMERVSRILRLGQLGSLAVAVEAVHAARLIAESPTFMSFSMLTRVVDMLGDFVSQRVHALVSRDTEMKRLFELIDLTLTAMRGSLQDGLISHPEGFDAISDLDWREWLKKHGATELTLNSSFLDTLYNIAFSYEEGDLSRPNAGAGEALRCAVRAFLTYRGSFFYKMQTGMGDAVFAPFYEVLRRRGVRFEFFHRLRNLQLSPEEYAGTPYIEAMHFDVQASFKTGDEYLPLMDVDGVPCWPSEPLWDQLVDGIQSKAGGVDFESHWDATAVNQLELKRNVDFDAVLLAVGLGEVPFVAGELLQRFPHWKAMTENVKTVATKAFQVWVSEDIESLGWRDDSVNLTGIPGPYETWADMTHLIAHESFPIEPKSLAYFCSSLITPDELPAQDDFEYKASYEAAIMTDSRRYLNENIQTVWPNAVDENGFRWSLLVDPEGRKHEDAESSLRQQYIRVNLNPTDRYVLFTAGSSKHRISPLDYDVSNMTVAGDWTDAGLNVGCVEAAIMSGRVAAHAISTYPALEDIPGFDHP